MNRKGHNRELEAQRARGYVISELIRRHQDEYQELRNGYLARIRGVNLRSDVDTPTGTL